MTALAMSWAVPTMDVTMFADLMDRLGEDLSRWPEDQRRAAEELLASSDAARTLLEEARALRQAVVGATVRAPAGLADRIVAAAGKLGAESAIPRGETESAVPGGKEEPALPERTSSAPPGKVHP